MKCSKRTAGCCGEGKGTCVVDIRVRSAHVQGGFHSSYNICLHRAGETEKWTNKTRARGMSVYHVVTGKLMRLSFTRAILQARLNIIFGY